MHDADAYLRYAQTLAERARPARRFLPWITIVVEEHEHALLHRDGRFERVLSAGRHRLWGDHLRVVRLDRRRQLQEIPAQELQTADGVTIKVSAQIAWSIADPRAAVSRDADHRTTLYALAQQAVRTVVSARELARLATEREAIADAMREAMAAEAGAIGLAIHAAALKDVMPNAETRKALAAVAFARQEGLAALEKARGEQAALRVLSNAARLLAEQPALAQLKGLQVLAEGLRGGAHVVVNTGPTGVIPLS